MAHSPLDLDVGMVLRTDGRPDPNSAGFLPEYDARFSRDVKTKLVLPSWVVGPLICLVKPVAEMHTSVSYAGTC